MHLVEYVLELAFDLYAFIGTDLGQFFSNAVKLLVGLRQIDNHHHVEKFLHDSLRYVENVDVTLSKVSTNLGNDANCIFAYNSNDSSLLSHDYNFMVYRVNECGLTTTFIFLLIFIPVSFGIKTKNLPGKEISVVTRGPLCPVGSLTT